MVIDMPKVVPYPVPIYMQETTKIDPFTILRKALHQAYFSKSNVECINMTTMIKEYIENVVIPHQLHLIQNHFYVLIGLGIVIAILIALLVKFREDEEIAFACFAFSCVVTAFLILYLHSYLSGLTHLHDLETISDMLERIVTSKICQKEVIAKAITILENW